MSVREAVGGSPDDAGADQRSSTRERGAGAGPGSTSDSASAAGPASAEDVASGAQYESAQNEFAQDYSAQDDTPQYYSSRRPWVAGALGATWALFVGLALLSCVVMAVWALSPTPVGDSGAAWRAVGLTWLGAHQTALTISGLPVTVLPLGAVLPALLLTRRGGGWAARLVPDPTFRELVAMLGGAAGAYGAGGAGVAWLSGTPSTGATLRSAFLACAAVAAVGSLWGVAREIELLRRVEQRVSPGVWRTVIAGWVGALGLFVLGAGLVALSLIVHVGDAFGALAAMEGGFLAVAGLTLVNVLTLPTLAIWGGAFAVGPGFSLGQLGSLSLFGGEVGALPALPVLVAIPSSAPAWAPVLLLGPIACGVLAGRVRWRGDVPTWPGALVTGVGVGVVVAPFVAGAVLLSSGSLGGGALAQIGPELRPVTAAAVGLVVLGFLGEAAAQSLALSWELHQAQRQPQRSDEEDEADLTPMAPHQPASEDAEALVWEQPATLGQQDSTVAESSDGSGETPATRRSLASTVLGVGSAARYRVVWAASSVAGQVHGESTAVGRGSQAGPAEPASAAAAVQAESDLGQHTTVALVRPDTESADSPEPADLTQPQEPTTPGVRAEADASAAFDEPTTPGVRVDADASATFDEPTTPGVRADADAAATPQEQGASPAADEASTP